MPICPKCDIEYKEGEKFCWECGPPLVAVSATPYCSKCKLENERGTKFCKECGSPLVQEIPPELDRTILEHPAAMPPLWLVGPEGQSYKLQPGRLILDRSEGCDLQLPRYLANRRSRAGLCRTKRPGY